VNLEGIASFSLKSSLNSLILRCANEISMKTCDKVSAGASREAGADTELWGRLFQRHEREKGEYASTSK
jgi:hypothetical protein